MDCEEAVCTQEKTSAIGLNDEIEDSSREMEESVAKQIIENAEVILIEESASLDESNEEEANPATEAENSDTVTLRPEDLMEVVDERESSCVVLLDSNSAKKQTEAFSNSVQESTNEETDAASNSSAHAVTPDEKESKQDSNSNLSPNESGTARQTYPQKPTPKITKTISIVKTTPGSGKPVSIKIVSKDGKISKNTNTSAVTDSLQTPVKCTSTPSIPKNMLLKRPPVILPKSQSLSTTTTATVSSSPSTSITSTLHKVLVPKNYVLVQTSTGLSFAPANQVQNGGLKKSVFHNVSTLKTANSSSVSIVNAPIAGKANYPKPSVLQKVQVPIQKASSPATMPLAISLSQTGSYPGSKLLLTSASSPALPSSINQGITSLKTTSRLEHSPTVSANKINLTEYSSSQMIMNRRPTHNHTEGKKIYINECQHPTCCTYRDKVHEELRNKLIRRDRKIKSTRTAKERCIKRIATQMIIMKNFQRQKAVQKSLESFPDSLCKTLVSAQLKPNEGVQAKRQHENQLKAFATHLHSISPQAYNYVKSVFNKVLPESNLIGSWNFSRVEETTAEGVDESGKVASTDEEEETEGDESDGDEEMLEEEEL